MVRSVTFAVALALGTVSIPVHALGLGDIKTESALNQAFKANIDLLSVAAGELDAVRVKLADPEAFKKAGIERPFFLTLLKFRPMRLENGKAVIQVSSDFPIREPFLDFLVEVSWPRGRLIREYTVLLDPPVTTRRRAPKVQAAPANTRTSRAAPQREVPDRPVAPAGKGEYGPVAANETLWSIAKKLRPKGASIEQMMIALLRANPDAFIGGDINRLRRGQVLRVPSSEEVLSLSRAEARRAYKEAQQQSLERRAAQLQKQARPRAGDAGAVQGKDGAADREARSELRIATARPEGEGEAGASEDRGDGDTIEDIKRKLLIARENAESSRLESESMRKEMEALRERLADMRRLLMLKDEQLARLQERVASETGEAVSVEAEEMRPDAETLIVEDDGGAGTTEAVIEADLIEAADAVLNERATSRPASPVVKNMPGKQPEAASQANEEAPAGATEAPVAAGSSEPAAPAPKRSESPKAPKPDPASATPVDESFDPLRFVQDNLLLVAGAGGVLALLLILLGLKRRSGGQEVVEEPLAQSSLVEDPARDEEVDDDIAGIAEDSQLGQEDETSFLSEFSPSEVNALRDETGEVDPVAEADVYIAYGRYQQAENLLRQAMERDPDRLALKHKLLEVYYATRNLAAFDELARGMVENGQDIVDQDAWARVRDMGRELAPDNPLYGAGGRAVSDAASGDVDAEAGDELETEISALASEFDEELSNLASDKGSGEDIDEASLDLDDLKELESLEALDADSRPLGDLDSLDLDLPDAGAAAKGDGASDGMGDSLELPSLDLEISERKPEESLDIDLEGQLDQLSDLASLEADLSQITEDLDIPAESSSSREKEETALDQPIKLDEVFAQDLDDAVDLEVDTPTSSSIDAEAVDTKLDLAKAFIEMGDGEGARDILEEIRQEGNDAQREEAEKLLAEIG